MNDRRKSDRRMPPSVAQHAIEERAELLARIEEQAREIELLKEQKMFWFEGASELADKLDRLKTQPSGVVLDGAERCSECSTITARLDGDGCAKWCCHCGARLNGDYVNVARLNSPPDSAGVVDERAAFKMGMNAINKNVGQWLDGKYANPYAQAAWEGWQARAALTAQPDHGAQSDAVYTVPDEKYDWGVFPSYLIDHCEGEVISEELLQRRIADMLADPHCGPIFRREIAAPAPGKEIE